MAAALGWDDLDALPRSSYLKAIEAMRYRYDSVPVESLQLAAQRYGARYIVAARPLGASTGLHRVGPSFGRYLLYELRR
jgi:hypothetical protein